jgi:hypothetical protein
LGDVRRVKRLAPHYEATVNRIAKEKVVLAVQRKSDGEPGTKRRGLGLQRLDDMTAMWKITMAMASRPSHDRPVCSKDKYG